MKTTITLPLPALRFLAILLCSLVSTVALAGGFVHEGVEYKLKKADMTAIAAKAQPAVVSGSYKLPQTIFSGGTYRVVAIGKSCFKGCSSLTELTIPEGVTDIGKKAFEGCTALQTLSLPESATNIDEKAYEGCPAIANYKHHINQNGIYYELLDLAGQEKTALVLGASTPETTTIMVANNINGYRVEAFQPGAFKGLASLLSATISEGFTEITESMFEGCMQLQSVSLPSTISSLGDAAFSGCSQLASLPIPQAVRSIGAQCFKGCKALTSLSLPDGLQTIGQSAFAASGLTTFILPAGVTKLGNATLIDCKQLTNLSLPDGLAALPQSFASGCSSLKSIIFPSSLKTVGDNCFADCSSLTSANVENLDVIGHQSFKGTSLTMRTINYTEKGINYELLFSPTSMTAQIASVDSLIDKDLVLPATVRGYRLIDIAESAFAYNEQLTSITIPQGITELGESIFYGCTNLASVSLPSGLKVIGASCFEDCQSLRSIVLPASVETLDQEAFEGCTSLQSVDLSLSNVETISYRAFANCGSLTQVRLSKKTTTIGREAFHYCSSLTYIYLPQSVESIGTNAFLGCTSLSEAEFGSSSLNSSGWWPFETATSCYYKIGDSKYDVSFPATAVIRSTKMQHNVMVNGVKGAYVVVNFDVNDMKGKTGQLAAYFYYNDDNDTPLKDFNSRYKTTDGNVASNINYTPGYDKCNYSEAKIFIPYTELHMSRSTKRHELKCKVSVWDNRSNELATGDWVYFYFTYNK